MKIEKLSENQIRCTLNKSDLASRQLKISELAYGSEKAKELFRDMMQQASYELGFEADDIPLMIEAIPVSADCIVLIVTKVDDPEELDTRFSKFSPSNSEDSDSDEYEYPFDDDYDTLETVDDSYTTHTPLTAKDELDESVSDVSKVSDNTDSTDSSTDVSSAAEDVISLFSKVKDYLNKNISDITSDTVSINRTDEENADSAKADNFIPLRDSLQKIESAPAKPTTKAVPHIAGTAAPKKIIRIFSFDSFDTVNAAAVAVYPVYHDQNTLYKDSANNIYYLALEKIRCSSVNFNKTCNILSEYGNKESLNIDSINYFEEHFECIIRNKAVQVLARL